METKRILLIGGPGTGKTSLISHFKSLGHTIFHEISREVTLAAKKKGIDQLFLTNPILFSELLLKGRISQFNDAPAVKKPVVFYDRGIPDVSAYMDFVGTTYPKKFTKANTLYRYDNVFFLPVWKEIYQSDNERYETLEQAIRIQDHLKQTYTNLGYSLIEVPFAPIEQRGNFILNSL
ncbi:ATP-binding protein [Gangjinia marincola]|uniref:ATP-binding protein n=1 Tax=Gangjinia marincola TaxID=578463 RepID=UPI0031DECF40